MMKAILLPGCLLLAACAVSSDPVESRKDTAVSDFIEVTELESVGVIRTMDQLSSREVNDTYVVVSTRNQDFLLEYYAPCMRRIDGGVEPDVRQGSRALYPGVDTYRGCRIKAFYELGPGQAEEALALGRSVGDDR